MVIDDYQQLAMRTSPEGHDRMLNGCMGLIGETGEIVDLVKKWKFQSGDHAELPRQKLIEECGDVLWYCAELSQGMHTEMSLTYSAAHHFDELREIAGYLPIERTVMFLAEIASKPAEHLFDNDIPLEDMKNEKRVLLMTEARASLAAIMAVIAGILEKYCIASMEEAMERNIEKLRKRYPDGFDPERSLHRKE